MEATKKSPKGNKAVPSQKEVKHATPSRAALELDALLYFMHKRYSATPSGAAPSLYTFLISQVDVVFGNFKHVKLMKKPNRQTLQILAPRVHPSEEEMRRVYLLNVFGDLIVKCQKTAYQQVREMLFGIVEPEGLEILIREYEEYMSSLRNNPKIQR